MADTTVFRILIADDQQDIIDALRLLLVDDGYEVTAARSPTEALDLMERIRAIDPTLPVLVMTAWSSIAGAVEAMRRGARDYIEKPWDDDKLLAAVRTQVELRRAVRRNQRLQAANQRLQRGTTPPFVGTAPAIVEIRRTIERVAPSDASVLITGEHGTGKEVVAA